jgi:thioredoxin 1
MNPPATQNGASPPWLFLGGLLLGALLLGFMVWDSIPPSKNASSANVVELTAENWEKEVVESKVPVVVDFWAPWCGPCKVFAPTIDKLADRYVGKVKVGKLNIDNANKIAEAYGITTIPCTLIFHGGKEPVDSFSGVQSEAKLVKAIDKALAKR